MKGKVRFEITLPISIVLNVLVVYLVTVLTGKISIGMVFAMVLSLLFFAHLVADKDRLSFLKNTMLTPGFMTFLLLYVFIFILNFNRVPYGADDFTHWAQHVKDMWILDDFYNSTANPALYVGHPNYPPAIQLFQVMFAKLTGFYRENLLFNAQQAFGFALLMPALINLRWSKKALTNILRIGFLVVLFLTLPLVISLTDQGTRGSFDAFYSILYVDSTLGLLFYFSLFVVFLGAEYKKPLASFLALSLLTAFMAITKEVAILFAGIAWIYFLALNWRYLIGAIKKLMQTFISKGSLRNIDIRSVSMIILFIFLPFLTYLTWQHQISISGRDGQFSAKSDLKQIPAIIAGSSGDESQKCVARGFLAFVIAAQAPIGHNKSYQGVNQCGVNDKSNLGSYIIDEDKINLTYWQLGIVVVAFLALISRYMMRIRDEKRRLASLSAVIAIGFIGYLLVLYNTYLFGGFSPSERMVLASIDRYIGTYMFAMVMLVVAIGVYRMASSRHFSTFVSSIVVFIWVFVLSYNQLLSPVRNLSDNADMYKERSNFAKNVEKECRSSQSPLILTNDNLDRSMMDYSLRSDSINYELISLVTHDKLERADCIAVFRTGDSKIYQKPNSDPNIKNNIRSLYIEN